jgi:CRP/FNR family transcriptional regulator, cyclic AMP receptor protein
MKLQKRCWEETTRYLCAIRVSHLNSALFAKHKLKKSSFEERGVDMSLGIAVPLKPAAEVAALDEANVSSALVTVFRGRFCSTLLPGRSSVQFGPGDVLYDIGDDSSNMFFIQKGFVKIGTLTHDGREIIYDIRKAGDVVGELCVMKGSRRDRAVALESAEAISVTYAEIAATLGKYPDLLMKLIEILCGCLGDAYEQITTLAARDLTERVTQVLLNLASKLSTPNGDTVRIPAYLTQEEISQMVGARRERVSTTLNALRRRGLLDYSSRGHLVLHVDALRGVLTQA